MANRHPGMGGHRPDHRRQLSKLEKALADQPADVVLRVRDYARTFDLDEDDELFAFAAALGLVTILIQEAPEKVNALFDQMRLELADWAKQNRRSFRQLDGYTETAYQLTKTLEKAITATNNASGSRYRSRHEILNAIEASAKHNQQLEREMKERFDQLEKQLVTLQEANQRTTRMIGLCGFGLLLVIMMGTVAPIRLTAHHRLLNTELAQQRTEIEWLVEKANRAECRYGIKPPDDPQCLPFQ